MSTSFFHVQVFSITVLDLDVRMSGNWTDPEPFKKTDEILTEVFGVQLMNYKFKLLLALNEFLLLSFFNGPGFFFQVMTFVCYECRVFSSIEFYQLLKNCKR